MNISPDVSPSDRVMIPLARISTDEGTQTRVNVRSGVVRDYALAMTQQLADGGLRFPAVVLFTDDRDYCLGDGLHRVLAARKAGLTEILADVRQGTVRDARLFGISANSDHGLPRSSADKRKAVALLLADVEWSQWSNREIARRCQVDAKTVNQMRRRASEEIPQIGQRKVKRGGTVYEMKVAAMGAAGDATTPDTPPVNANVPANDPLGIPLPEAKERVFAALGDFQEATDLFDRLTTLVDRIAQGPSGELSRLALVRTANNGRPGLACPDLRIARSKLVGAAPYCGYCPNCHPASSPVRGHRDCNTCGGRGWTTRAAFESCRDSDRQLLMKMRAANPT